MINSGQIAVFIKSYLWGLWKWSAGGLLNCIQFKKNNRSIVVYMFANNPEG